MIIRYKNNFYKITSDDRILIGYIDTGYTWFNCYDEKVINNILYCGEVVN